MFSFHRGGGPRLLYYFLSLAGNYVARARAGKNVGFVGGVGFNYTCVRMRGLVGFGTGSILHLGIHERGCAFGNAIGKSSSDPRRRDSEEQ